MAMEGMPSHEGRKTFTMTMPNGTVEDITGKSGAEIGEMMESYHDNEN